jgi:hypothetical protein
MRIKEVAYTNTDHSTDLLNQLIGRIFHVTTRAAFEQIQESGAILHNRDERFPLNPTSIDSFGRTRGWVCLFDLRDQSVEIMRKWLGIGNTQYDYLYPEWFRHWTPDFCEWNLAYLFLDPTAWPKLKPNKLADEERRKTGQWPHCVPAIEVWFQGNLHLSLIEESLLVRIREKAPKDNALLYAAHMSKVAEQNQNQE